MTHLSVSVVWDDVVLEHELVSRGRSFACEAIARYAMAGVDGDGTAWVCDGRGRRPVPAGSEERLRFDNVEVVVVCSADPLPPRTRARVDRRVVACHVGAAVVVAAGLGACGLWEPTPRDEAWEVARVEQIRVRLLAARAVEGEDSEEAADQAGGTGTRAKGEEGQMGSGRRYGVKGPTDDPHLARRAALEDAAEFGMIGIARSGAAPPARPSPPAAGGFVPLAATAEREDEGTGERFEDHGFGAPVETAEDPISTFAVDVDTGSYAVLRRKLSEGRPVPPSAVRVEEVVNYFDHGYAGPSDPSVPFEAHLDAAPSPFDAGEHVVRIGLQARRVTRERRTPAHLVYLVDTSGSMEAPDKIELAKESLRLLTNALKPGDTVALCTYAGDERLVLGPTGVERRDDILAGIDGLTSGGGTAMESGIDLAYRLAEQTRVPGHINRVIVLSDGDANIGAGDPDTILSKIEAHKARGITLSTIGFGTGNYNDAMMERLADRGDGNYRYIDGLAEANRVFVEQLDGMLEVVARDVKIQVAFNRAAVRSYRLIGYENRDVADEDFRDDQVDGGEVGAGHQVTALYHVVLRHPVVAIHKSWLSLHVRYRDPAGGAGKESVFELSPERVARSFESAPPNLRFATAIAGFAEVLRRSPYAEAWGVDDMLLIASDAHRGMPVGTRAERVELLGLMERAVAL